MKKQRASRNPFDGQAYLQGVYVVEERLPAEARFPYDLPFVRGLDRGQFIIATHSPILLTFPGAAIVDFDDRALPRVAVRDTKHYQITRGMLESPERYWKGLDEEEARADVT